MINLKQKLREWTGRELTDEEILKASKKVPEAVGSFEPKKIFYMNNGENGADRKYFVRTMKGKEAFYKTSNGISISKARFLVSENVKTYDCNGRLIQQMTSKTERRKYDLIFGQIFDPRGNYSHKTFIYNPAGKLWGKILKENRK